MRVCVFYWDSSSLDGIQAKLNALMYLKVQVHGFKFARILTKLRFRDMARFMVCLPEKLL